MHENIRNSIRSVCYAIFLISILNVSVLSQHRGDNLSFQGWSEESNNGVQAVAMGRAFTSISGDLNALFWNPAGLIGISNNKLLNRLSESRKAFKQKYNDTA